MQVELIVIATSCPEVQHIYIDFGCRVSVSWERFINAIKVRYCSIACKNWLLFIQGKLIWICPRSAENNWQTVFALAQAHRNLISVPGENLQIMVNWLHAASHDFQCQLKNSGRYRTGAGWAVGEQAEQLWALTNVSVCSGNSSTCA